MAGDSESPPTAMETPVSPAELRLHVERIVSHAEFEDSPRHRHLLRYLADHSIATSGRSLSPQAIESDVLSRSAGGRGQAVTPALVVVADVRRKLERYAAGAGRSDTIRITIPRDDCRLEATRLPPPSVDPLEHTSAPPGADRSGVIVVEFDAEPAVRHLAMPLATAIGERLGELASISATVCSRREIADRGLAIEHAVAAWQAEAGVHGMLIAFSGEQASDASLGASVRLLGADGGVVWTLWCEQPLGMVGTDDALRLMARKVAEFVAGCLKVSRQSS